MILYSIILKEVMQLLYACLVILLSITIQDKTVIQSQSIASTHYGSVTYGLEHNMETTEIRKDVNDLQLSQKTRNAEPLLDQKAVKEDARKYFQYGKQIDHYFSSDQLQKCYPLLKLLNDQQKLCKINKEFCCADKQELISKEKIHKQFKYQSIVPIQQVQQIEGDQYVWIALVYTIILTACLLYKMKINLLLNVLEQVQLKADIKVTEYEQKLGQLEELKKIYEVYWNRVVYKNEVDVCYQHTVYQGRFLTQQTYVYVVRLEHADIGTLQYKLGKLLNCSHQRLAKLYYYTKTPEFMLIFTEKINPLSFKKLDEHFSIQTSITAKKSAIINIIETLAYLQQKIQLKMLPLESIQLNIIEKAPNSQFYDYKINTIPCLFRKMHYNCYDQDFDTASEDQPICYVRLNIVSLFHLILLEGRIFNKEQFLRLSKLPNQPNEEYVEFLDFILHEAKAIGHTHQLLFKQVLQHPFLWDSKRKILFLADFSNYMETHLDDSRLDRLEKYALQYQIIKPNWIKEFHSIFASQVNIYRKYDFSSIRDLIRMIRNKLNHFHQIPKQVKNHIGKTPQGFIQYCLTIFPKLLPFAYIYTRKKKWKLHMK